MIKSVSICKCIWMARAVVKALCDKAELDIELCTPRSKIQNTPILEMYWIALADPAVNQLNAEFCFKAWMNFVVRVVICEQDWKKQEATSVLQQSVFASVREGRRWMMLLRKLAEKSS